MRPLVELLHLLNGKKLGLVQKDARHGLTFQNFGEIGIYVIKLCFTL
jgi:hypothetical protein